VVRVRITANYELKEDECWMPSGDDNDDDDDDDDDGGGGGDGGGGDCDDDGDEEEGGGGGRRRRRRHAICPHGLIIITRMVWSGERLPRRLRHFTHDAIISFFRW